MLLHADQVELAVEDALFGAHGIRCCSSSPSIRSGTTACVRTSTCRTTTTRRPPPSTPLPREFDGEPVRRSVPALRGEVLGIIPTMPFDYWQSMLGSMRAAFRLPYTSTHWEAPPGRGVAAFQSLRTRIGVARRARSDAVARLEITSRRPFDPFASPGSQGGRPRRIHSRQQRSRRLFRSGCSRANSGCAAVRRRAGRRNRHRGSPASCPESR